MGEIISQTDCQTILKNYSSEYKKFIGCEVNRISEKTLGFLGEHFLLKIFYEDSDKCKKHLSLFVKCLPRTNKNHREYVQQLAVFKKETFFYKHLLPELSKLSSSKITPRCYLVIANECLVLENLTDFGFGVEEKPFDLRQSTSVLETMAALHTSSIAYEEYRSNNSNVYRLYEEFEKELEGSSFNFNEGHARYKWTKNSIRAIGDCILLLPVCRNQDAAVENLWNFFRRSLPELMKPSRTFRNVITHDDLWNNNIMLKNLPDGKIESVLVDFQMVKYAPPALDFLTFLYLNLERNFLQSNIEKLEEIYYKNFCENLINHKINPITIMPKDMFMKSLNIYKLPALLQAAMFSTISFISSSLTNAIISNESVFEEFAFTDRSKYITMEFKENANFRERFSGILIPLTQCLLCCSSC